MGYRIASIALAPLFALQGRRVRQLAGRLPEPAGPREGIRGEGPSLRLLVLGDSAAAGVGARAQEEALSGRLLDELAPVFHVSWALVARTGATTAGTARHLTRVPRETLGPFDVTVVSLGSNDVVGGRALQRWLADLDALAELLRTRFGTRHILFSALPPMHRLPIFPQPLRWYLGARAQRFDRTLERWARAQPGCEYVPLALAPGVGESERDLLATDGFHPGPRLYCVWAAEVSERIRARWAPPSDERTGSPRDG